MGKAENRIAQLDAVMEKANEQPAGKAMQRMAQIDAVMQNEEALRRREEVNRFNETAANTPAPIGKEQIREAYEIFVRYKNGKTNFDDRLKANERWYNNKVVQEPSQQGIQKVFTSSWLFNALNNKHADLMDNYPEPTVLPREESDRETARILSSVIPVVFEQNKFKKTYSKNSWNKVSFGTSCYGVFWDSTKLNGLGDISITKINLLNLFWEPGIEDIQDSANIFLVSEADNKLLESQYPVLKGKLTGGAGGEAKEYEKEDTEDKKDKSTVFEWYYKKNIGGKTVLHYVKWCADEVLYATENERMLKIDGNNNVVQPVATQGLYNHGKYPFVLDVLFPMEGVPTGAGYIDKLKDAQEQIDILNNAMVVNAKMCATPRWIVPLDTQINEKEFADWTNPFVHLASGKINEQTAIPLSATPMSDVVIATFDRKIEELKETGSNRDFANGSTASGVTSGAAIAALQEAGNKTSRSSIQGTYEAIDEITCFVIELIRQFYNTTRCFRITGANSEMQFEQFNNSAMQPQKTEFGERLPIFDVKIKAHKQNPFSKVAQNQDMINFYSMGFFNPSMADQSLTCLEMLDIEGKERLVEKITMNGTLLQKVQQMQPLLARLAMQVDELTGSNILQTLAQQGLLGDVAIGQADIIPQAMSANDTNSIGAQNNRSGYPTVDKAKKKVNEASEVK